MARHLNKVLNLRCGLNTFVHGQSAERKPIGNAVQSLHTDKVRCKALDVALVEELAGLDEVGISFLEFAPLDDHLLLISLTIFRQELLKPIVNLGMGIPQALSNPLVDGIFEVEEDCAFGGCAIPKEISNMLGDLRHVRTH